ncbi:MAG: HAMP domain-containing sensor histidine kinase [Myxococcota bacterium]
MTRIRIALLLVAVATLGLVGALAWRAYEGLSVERTVRHSAVAERTFEEMERQLGGFLDLEEARPFEHYAFTLPATGERSPLARPHAPFVIGAFSIGPDGAVTTPLEPSGDAPRGDAPTEDVTASAALVRTVVNALWSENRAAAAAPEEPLAKADVQVLKKGLAQDPGTTRVVSGPGVDDQLEAELARKEPTAKEEAARDTYDVLGRLNRAAEERQERKQKVAQAAPEAVFGQRRDAPREPFLPELEALFDEEAAAVVAPERSAGGLSSSADALAFREGDQDALAERSAAPVASAVARPRAPAPAVPPGDRGASQDTIRITFDPMVGIATGDWLVLHRTVWVDRQAYRQGLVLDRGAVGAWLADRVIRSAGLASVAEVRFGAKRTGTASGDAYLFAHRFAEPFDALEAELLLRPLPGVASPRPLYALVGVLLLVGAGGLVAIYRNATAALQYAERRSNFVAAVTHELKTPLTAIRMYAEMLRDDLVPDDQKRREYYGTITDESERLSRLVDNVLEFSKLEGGRRDLSMHVGAVGPVLTEAVEKLRAHAEQEGFSLRVELASELPTARFDRDALLQVLFNLVDNAMKYARGAARREIEVAARAESGAVAIVVRDWGPGVAREQWERVFEPFFRGGEELTRATQGTGIGLALVKELGERMGARVSGANASDGGFAVELMFPAVV